MQSYNLLLLELSIHTLNTRNITIPDQFRSLSLDSQHDSKTLLQCITHYSIFPSKRIPINLHHQTHTWEHTNSVPIHYNRQTINQQLPYRSMLKRHTPISRRSTWVTPIRASYDTLSTKSIAMSMRDFSFSHRYTNVSSMKVLPPISLSSRQRDISQSHDEHPKSHQQERSGLLSTCQRDIS